MTNYGRTHPWLTFELDLRSAPPELWLLLGEARSKIEHLAGVPLRPAVASRMTEISLLKGALATAAIEGNTLSESEAQKFLNEPASLAKSKQYMGAEIRNVVDACNDIWMRCGGGAEELTLERILSYNALLLKDTQYGPDVIPGMLREHSVGVARYRAPDPQDVPELMRRFVEWFTSPTFRTKVDPFEDAIGPAILGAVLAHLYFAWIHPFGDGNGRTARLIEFAILLQADVPTVAAHLLSNHYNLTRAEYYRQLDAASGRRDPIPFIIYALRGFVDGLRDQIAKVRDEQVDVAWSNYVHEKFRELTGRTARRRREVVLALSSEREPLPRERIAMLSSTLADEYRPLTTKAITRDLQALKDQGLVEDAGKGRWRAKKEVIEAFIPPRRTRVQTRPVPRPAAR